MLSIKGIWQLDKKDYPLLLTYQRTEVTIQTTLALREMLEKRALRLIP